VTKNGKKWQKMKNGGWSAGLISGSNLNLKKVFGSFNDKSWLL
jgi:hypothetical protein